MLSSTNSTNASNHLLRTYMTKLIDLLKLISLMGILLVVIYLCVVGYYIIGLIAILFWVFIISKGALAIRKLFS